MPTPLFYDPYRIADKIVNPTGTDPVRIAVFGNSIYTGFGSFFREWATPIGGVDLDFPNAGTTSGIGSATAVTGGVGGVTWCIGRERSGRVYVANGAAINNTGYEIHQRLAPCALGEHPGKYALGVYAQANQGDWTARAFSAGKNIVLKVLFYVGPDGEPLNVFQLYGRSGASLNMEFKGTAFNTYAESYGYRLETLVMAPGTVADFSEETGFDFGVMLSPAGANTTNGAVTRLAGMWLEVADEATPRYSVHAVSGTVPSAFLNTSNYADAVWDEAFPLLEPSIALIALAVNYSPTLADDTEALILRLRESSPNLDVILFSEHETTFGDGADSAAALYSVAQRLPRVAFGNINAIAGKLSWNWKGITSFDWISGHWYHAGHIVRRPNNHYYLALRQTEPSERTTVPESAPTLWLDMGTSYGPDNGSWRASSENGLLGDGVHIEWLRGASVMGARQWGLLQTMANSEARMARGLSRSLT